MSVNDEFDLDNIIEGTPKNGKAEKLKKAVATDELDPEYDRDNWPTIRIEAENDKPNYEFLSAHGTMKNGQPFGHELQVMRGVDVQVPPSIVYALRDAVATHFQQRRDPVTGRMQMVRMDRSSVPWHLVKPGKYIR